MKVLDLIKQLEQINDNSGKANPEVSIRIFENPFMPDVDNSIEYDVKVDVEVQSGKIVAIISNRMDEEVD
jgi:hypothetical protein